MPPSLLDEISPPKHPVFGPTELSRFKAWTIPICLYFSQKKWSPEGSQTLFFFLSSWRLSTSLYRMRKKKRSGLRDVEEKKRIGVWLVGASHKPPSPHTHQTAQKCRNENNKKKRYTTFFVCVFFYWFTLQQHVGLFIYSKTTIGFVPNMSPNSPNRICFSSFLFVENFLFFVLKTINRNSVSDVFA